MTMLIYLGKEYPAKDRISFVKAVKASIRNNEELIDDERYYLKTLCEFYDSEALKAKGIVELVLPSWEVNDLPIIKQFVAENSYLYRDKVVLMYYPREIELAVMSLLYPISKAIIARSNNHIDNGICVYSKDSEYEVGKHYAW